MSDFFLLSEAQMRCIKPYFPLSHGIARVDDRMVISGTFMSAICIAATVIFWMLSMSPESKFCAIKAN